MHIKPKDPKQFVTPSPGAYNPDLADKDIKQSAPKYSFGIKPKNGKPAAGPAPNAYSLQKVKDTPSYSLGSRPKEGKKYVTPAPGAYESCDTNQYKQKNPAFSLSTRYPVPSDITMKPGPGAYTPEKVLTLLLTLSSVFTTNFSVFSMLIFRLTPNLTNLNIALAPDIPNTCLVPGLYQERRHDRCPTNAIHSTTTNSILLPITLKTRT